jgi:hypothetical protein
MTDHASNPLLAPIHGVSLKDYGAMCALIANGVPQADVLRAMGLETPIFDEVNELWVARMQEDSDFTVTTLFGQYFGEAKSHPMLGNLQAAPNAQSADTLERLRADRWFYGELAAAREAAYESGRDGAQWMLDTHGIALADFQAVAMVHMAALNADEDPEVLMGFVDYQQAQKRRYAAKFSAEHGGGIADDVQF